MRNASFKAVGLPNSDCLVVQENDRTWSDIVARLTARIRGGHIEAQPSMKELILGCVDLLSRWSYNSCSVASDCSEAIRRSCCFTRGELTIFYSAPDLEKGCFTDALIELIEGDRALSGHGLLHHVGDIKRSRLLNSESNGDQFMGMDIIVFSDIFGSHISTFSDLKDADISSLIGLISKIRDRNLFGIIVSDIPLAAGLAGQIEKMGTEESENRSLLAILDRAQEADVSRLSALSANKLVPGMSLQ